MIETFLIILTFIWLIFASLSDIRSREVFNWLNFSFVLFILAFRGFYAVVYNDLAYFLWGLFGVGVMFVIANLFYYMRAFAGGDAKLLIVLGAVLPFSYSFSGNLIILGLFVFLLMFFGGIYSLLYALVLTFIYRKEFSREFKKQFKLNKKYFYFGIGFAFISLFLGFIDSVLFVLSGVLFILPFVYVYSKSIEESCMIQSVSSKKVTIGDWLYETIKLKNGKIEPYWEGLSEKQVNLLHKMNINVKIKSGIPFVPSFLFAFLALLLLWESSWSFFQFLRLF